MLSVKDDKYKKKSVETIVVKKMKERDYSLNIVNRYGENLMHVAATNDCTDIIRHVLEQREAHSLKRKNAFGWTPLMQAIRNRNVKTVEILLENDAIINDFSYLDIYLGLSVLSLATAASKDLFELVYNACPSALEYAGHDDVNPLCIAALKNDKELFFKLIYLGLDVSKANAITNIMMKRSSVPEIAALAKPCPDVEDYWKMYTNLIDISYEDEFSKNSSLKNDIKKTEVDKNSQAEKENKEPLVKILNSRPKLDRNRVPNSLDLSETNKNFLKPSSEIKNLISPTLMYINESVIPASPNTSFIKAVYPSSPVPTFRMEIDKEPYLKSSTFDNSYFSPRSEETVTPKATVLDRCQVFRPENINVKNAKCNLDESLGFTPEFSPSKSPNLPNSIGEEDNMYDEKTPTPPKYKSPPRGIILSPREARLVLLLQRHELGHLIPIFLEQEVDINLFFTLNEQDLEEIGIENKSDRQEIMYIIEENIRLTFINGRRRLI